MFMRFLWHAPVAHSNLIQVRPEVIHIACSFMDTIQKTGQYMFSDHILVV